MQHKTSIALLLSLILSVPSFAQRARNPRIRPSDSRPSTQEAGQGTEGEAVADHLSVTDHEITVHGQVLKYKSTAGTLAMKDEADKPKANIFFVAYEKQPASEDRSQRPITFVFNGGPGAAAVWLHLGVAGPRRVSLNDQGDPPPPPYRLVDNEETWLTATDLVFIDPVGTGYSRPAPGEKAEQFYGVEEDVRSVGQFIRTYLTRYQRWLSPRFLAGESYGTTRAAALSGNLMEDGISLNGIVLISSVLNFETISFASGNELPYALYLPSYTAIAWYHKKLAADLQKDLAAALKESEQWALNGYLTALAAGVELAKEDRQAAVQKLARLTGLPAAYVDRANLRVDPGEFRKQLLADEHRVLGRFDARLTGFDSDPLNRTPDYDPSLTAFRDAYSATINDYVRRELRFESDLPYEVLSDRVHPWNFGSAGMGYLDVVGQLRSAIVQTPNLKVMFCSGLFDLATPYLGAKYTVSHLDLGLNLRDNVSQTFYDGGHMVYHHRSDRESLTKNVIALIQQSVPPSVVHANGAGSANSE